MPIEGSREPAAELAPRRKRAILERIYVIRAAAIAEAGVGAVDLQPARDHPHEQQERHPVGEPDDPMMSLDWTNRGLGRGHRGNGHGLSILSAMRAATLLAVALVVSCRTQNASVAARTADTLSFADMSPSDSADSTLLTPRLVTEPTVLVFWLA